VQRRRVLIHLQQCERPGGLLTATHESPCLRYTAVRRGWGWGSVVRDRQHRGRGPEGGRDRDKLCVAVPVHLLAKYAVSIASYDLQSIESNRQPLEAAEDSSELSIRHVYLIGSGTHGGRQRGGSCAPGGKPSVRGAPGDARGGYVNGGVVCIRTCVAA